MSKIVRYERPKNSFKIFRFSPYPFLQAADNIIVQQRRTKKQQVRPIDRMQGPRRGYCQGQGGRCGDD